uniref:Uncharacterized protein n=1 Tax=Romanomermis culicivorax TaxID=13658 RepID=A0A915JH18_ROMCU
MMRPRTSQGANRATANEVTNTLTTTTTSEGCSLPNEKRPLLEEHACDTTQPKAPMKFIDETPRSASPALSHHGST